MESQYLNRQLSQSPYEEKVKIITKRILFWCTYFFKIGT